jgi:hypothetical protein
MWIITCDDKLFHYLNSGLMVEDLFLKHGGEGKWRVQTFVFAP